MSFLNQASCLKSQCHLLGHPAHDGTEVLTGTTCVSVSQRPNHAGDRQALDFDGRGHGRKEVIRNQSRESTKHDAQARRTCSINGRPIDTRDQTASLRSIGARCEL
jgi:hypothetical protein